MGFNMKALSSAEGAVLRANHAVSIFRTECASSPDLTYTLCSKLLRKLAPNGHDNYKKDEI
jgi:hypothetical protein